MNYKIVLKLLSIIFLMLAGAVLVCTGVSFFYRADVLEQNAASSWFICFCLAILISFSFYIPSRNASLKIFKRDMFLQHLDAELTEEDVQKITSGSKTKTQITVITATRFDKTDFSFLNFVFAVYGLDCNCFFPTCSGQNWALCSLQIP